MSRKILIVPLKLGSSWTERLPPDVVFLGCAMVDGEGPCVYCSSAREWRDASWLPWEFSLVSVGGQPPPGDPIWRLGAFQVSRQHHPWFVYVKRVEAQ